MLEQVDGDTGAASSLIGCTFNFFGCIGMVAISTDSLNRVVLMGAMDFVIGLLTLMTWPALSKKHV